jgi:hypothetical protein
VVNKARGPRINAPRSKADTRSAGSEDCSHVIRIHRVLARQLAVCFSFNVIGRLADAFGFFVPGPKAFEAGAKYLLARGYR